MALSQQQKNNLLLLKENPVQFLSSIKNGTIDINGYQNEFLQDGKGLSHFLVECFSDNPSTYYPILKEVLLNSSLSLEDPHKSYTPLQLFIKFNNNLTSPYSDNTENLEKLFLLCNININKISNEDYSQIMHIFLNNNDLDKFNKLFEQKKMIYCNDYWELIFQRLIDDNQVNEIINLIETGINTKQEILKIKTSLLNREYSNTKERSNLLVLAISRSEEIANYFLDNLNFPLNGQTTYNMPPDTPEDKKKYISPYRTSVPPYTRGEKTLYSSIHCLDEAFEKNNEKLFVKILNLLKIKQISHLLYEEKLFKKENKPKPYYSSYSNTTPSTTLLNKILAKQDSNFYQILKNNISDIVNNDNHQEKLNLINQIFQNKDIDLKEKYFFAKKIIPFIKKITKDNNHSYDRNTNSSTILNNILINIYSKDTLTFDDIDIASKILKMGLNNSNLPFTNNELCKVKLFNNNDLLNNFIAVGLDINTNYETNKAINPFYLYYKMRGGNYGNNCSSSSINAEKINKNFDTFKLLGKENIYLPVAGQLNLLNYSLSKLDLFVFNNLSDKEIFQLAQQSNQTYAISAIKNPTDEEEINNYRLITERMFNLGFSFFHDNKIEDFYKILKYHNNMELIFNIITKEDKSLFELSKDIEFWKNITTETTSTFVLNNGADFNSIEMTIKIANLQDKERKNFDFYLKNGGNISFTNDDKDTFLHYLVKNDRFEEAIYLLNYQPQLTQQVNKQNKIPLSYMIVAFDKKCKLPNLNDGLFLQQKEFFNKYIEVGKFSNNKKSKEFLLHQLNKYSNISNVIPNLKELVSYKILDASTPVKSDTENYKKRMKI